jgi:hypothetical protein
MILQIIEIAFGSLTAITCSALTFVSAWDGRRMHAMQREVDAMDAEEKAAKDLIASKELAEKVERERVTFPEDATLDPFLYVTQKTICPKCNTSYEKKEQRGILLVPRSCKGDNKYRCSIRRPHLHAHCVSCNSHWVMATHDASVDTNKSVSGS